MSRESSVAESPGPGVSGRSGESKVMRRRLLWPVLLMSCAAGASAETAYVTDMLRLGLHRAEDTSDSAFRTLVSGAQLEILERRANYARVRTMDGEVGWVRSAYLVADKPAQLRLGEIEAEIDRVREELMAALTAGPAAEGGPGELNDPMRFRPGSAEPIHETLARLQQENAAYASRLEIDRRSVPLSWAGAALLVTLIGGFVAGMAWVDYLSRRRHGGFRVY